MNKEEILQYLSVEDLCKCVILVNKFEELIKTLNRIADASESIAQSLDNLDKSGITAWIYEGIKTMYTHHLKSMKKKVNYDRAGTDRSVYYALPKTEQRRRIGKEKRVRNRIKRSL